MSSGAIADVSHDAFESALMQVCTDLTRQIAADGEGAETLIEVLVDEVRDEDRLAGSQSRSSTLRL